MQTEIFSPLRRQNNAISPDLKSQSFKLTPSQSPLVKKDLKQLDIPVNSFLKRSGAKDLSPTVNQNWGLKQLSDSDPENSVPVSPMLKPSNNAIDISMHTGREINVSQRNLAPSPFRKSAPKLSNKSHSSVFTQSEDSFIAEVEKEVKVRAEREAYLDDSDEDDFLLPKSIKLKILEEKRKTAKLKEGLFKQEKEDQMRRLRIEVVKVSKCSIFFIERYASTRYCSEHNYKLE